MNEWRVGVGKVLYELLARVSLDANVTFFSPSFKKFFRKITYRDVCAHMQVLYDSIHVVQTF